MSLWDNVKKFAQPYSDDDYDDYDEDDDYADEYEEPAETPARRSPAVPPRPPLWPRRNPMSRTITASLPPPPLPTLSAPVLAVRF